MPQPFRLFTPPPTVAEKLLLVQTGPLYLALPVSKVQEVLLKASVIKQQRHAVTSYHNQNVLVILGSHTCPPMSEAILVLFQTQSLKSGLVAIACTTVPKLAQCSDQEWLVGDYPLPKIWQTTGKAYQLGEIFYTYTTELIKH